MVMINKGKTREQYQSHVNTTTARTRRLRQPDKSNNEKIAQVGKSEKHDSVYLFRETKEKQGGMRNKWNTKEKKIGQHVKQVKTVLGSNTEGLIPAAV